MFGKDTNSMSTALLETFAYIGYPLNEDSRGDGATTKRVTNCLTSEQIHM